MKKSDKRKELSDRAEMAAMRIADLRCRKAGRKTWDWGDFDAYVKAYRRLWPAGARRKLTIGEWEKRYSRLHHGYKRGKMGHKPLQYSF